MRCLAVFLAALAGAGVAHADSVVLAPAQDNTIYGENGGALGRAGPAPVRRHHEQHGAERRALVEFDIAGAVPAGSTITSVTLTLRLDKTQTANLPIALTRSQPTGAKARRSRGGEEGGGGSAATGDATWTQRFYPGDRVDDRRRRRRGDARARRRPSRPR